MIHADIDTPYQTLSPDTVLDSIEQQGYCTNGRLLALNSYENRVYQIGLETGEFIVAKYYRPARWNDATILEEHQFSHELAALELPIVAPIKKPNGDSLLHHAGFRFALFKRCGGRAPELDNLQHLKMLGRLMGRMHAVARVKNFNHRPSVSVQRLGTESLDFLQQQHCIAAEVAHNFVLAATQMLDICTQQIEQLGALHRIRLHGDCHPGNILWTAHGPHFVDLDDCQTGPAMQDLWMLLSGPAHEMEQQLAILLAEYTAFCDFDPVELALIEPLRSLRLIHYNAWLARRWSDPAFPRHFPWFDSARYWEEQLYTLRDQLERLQQPTLRWPI